MGQGRGATGGGHADRAGAPTRGAAGPPGDRDGALVAGAAGPAHPRRAEKLPTLALWAVLAPEDHPPAGVEPIAWLLLTTCAVHTPEDAVARVDWYACRLEARQLETADRLRRGLAGYSVMAWHILYATRLSRAMPEAPCPVRLDPEAWQALSCTIHLTATPPATPRPCGRRYTGLAAWGASWPVGARANPVSPCWGKGFSI